LLVIAGDVMLFAGLLYAFWVLRLAAPVWPPPLQPRLPVGVTAMNTAILFASGLAVVWAVGGSGVPSRLRLLRGLGTGALLGALFIAIQGYEWVRLVRFGMTIASSAYGSLFYALVGAHAVHVLAALGWLATILLLVWRGRVSGRRPALLRACALYWFFVVALWPVLYLSVYLV
jgi:heme/copper-type cytochrome/quinol oxidase subunit 3